MSYEEFDGYTDPVFDFTSTLTNGDGVVRAHMFLGKKFDGSDKITWLLQEEADFDASSVYGHIIDLVVKLDQYHDGTPGSCDLSETVSCQYQKLYAASCSDPSQGCMPTEEGCDVPVEYFPKNSNASQRGTLYMYFNASTYELTSTQLFAGKNGRVSEVPKSRGGIIKPSMLQTPTTISKGLFDQATSVTKNVSFDWSRELDITWAPPKAGTTYLGIVVGDYLGTEKHVIGNPPSFTPGTPDFWSPSCADDEIALANTGSEATEMVSGSMDFAVSGLNQNQVVAAAKDSLSKSLNVGKDFISASATESRRLRQARGNARRLAGNWKIQYDVQVPASKATKVEQAATKIATDPKVAAKFKTTLVTSLKTVAQASGQYLDASAVTGVVVAQPTKKVVTTTTTTAGPTTTTTTTVVTTTTTTTTTTTGPTTTTTTGPTTTTTTGPTTTTTTTTTTGPTNTTTTIATTTTPGGAPEPVASTTKAVAGGATSNWLASALLALAILVSL